MCVWGGEGITRGWEFCRYLFQATIITYFKQIITYFHIVFIEYFMGFMVI